MARVQKVAPDFSRDRWETWLRRGLMMRAQRIPGTNDYGFAPDQWRRLQALVDIDSQLFSRKSPEAVAYFAALAGIEVPVDLLADHLEKSIRAFYKYLRRRLIQQSSGRYDPRMFNETDARRLAHRMADDVIAITPIRNNAKREMAKQFAVELSFVIIQMTFNVRTSSPSVGEAVRKIASGMFMGAFATLGARHLKKMLESEGPRFVDPELGDNRLLEEIRSTQRTQPHLLAQACLDSGLAFAACERAFEIQGRHDSRSPHNLTGTAREHARGFYWFLPMVSAYFLTFALDYPQSQFLELVRRSNGAVLEQKVRRLNRVTEWRRRRLGRGL